MGRNDDESLHFTALRPWRADTHEEMMLRSAPGAFNTQAEAAEMTQLEDFHVSLWELHHREEPISE